MLNPIKRVWVPKKPATETPPVPVEAQSQPAEVAKQNVYFEEVTEPEVVEKFSDSVWAAFESIKPSP
jgi:hypothetical protein